MPALFERLDEDRYLPTAHSVGPWDPGSLHGGPIAVLVAGAVEAVPTDHPLTVSRLTVELERPVPLTALTVRAEVTRPGRKVRVVDVDVHDDEGRRLVRARALQQRIGDVDLDAWPDARADTPPITPPEGIEPLQAGWEAGDAAFHLTGSEHRFVRGSFDRLGSVEVWIRVVADVVDGIRPSPLQQLVGAADFGNGVSAVVPFDQYLFLNPDLTIHLERPPTDDWTLLVAETRHAPTGTGLAESALWDRSGRIGRSLQSLLLEQRGGTR